MALPEFANQVISLDPQSINAIVTGFTTSLTASLQNLENIVIGEQRRGNSLVESVKSGIGSLASVVSDIPGRITNAVTAPFAAIAAIPDMIISGITAPFQSIIGTLSGIGNRIGSFVSSVLGSVTTAFGKVFGSKDEPQAQIADPELIGAVNSLFQPLVDIKDAFERFTELFEDKAALDARKEAEALAEQERAPGFTLPTFVDDAEDEVSGFFDSFIAKFLLIKTVIFDGIKAAFATISRGIISLVPNLLRFVGRLLLRFVLPLVAVVNFFVAFGESEADTFLGKLADAIQGMFGKLIELITFGLFTEEDFGKVVESVFAFFDNFVENFDMIVEAVTDKFSELVAFISDAFGPFFDSVSQFVSEGVDFIGEKISGLIDAIGDFISGIGDSIGDMAGQLGEFFVSTLRRTVNGMVEFVASLIDDLPLLGSVGDDIAEKLRSLKFELPDVEATTAAPGVERTQAITDQSRANANAQRQVAANIVNAPQVINAPQTINSSSSTVIAPPRTASRDPGLKFNYAF